MKVRVNSQIESHPWPDSARMLIEHFTKLSHERGSQYFTVSVPEIPMSLNSQYTKKIIRDRKTGKRRIHQSLKAEVKTFRLLIQSQRNRIDFNPNHAELWAAVILFESPHWVTKKHTVRIQDGDNLVKPYFDAVEKAFEIPDQRIWEHHPYKVYSSKVRTTGYFFGLGDIVKKFG